jgi:hypothetical protein
MCPNYVQHVTDLMAPGAGSSTANSTMADVTNGVVNTNSAAVTLDKTKSLSGTASASNPPTINNANNTGCSVELFNASSGPQNGNTGPSEFAIDQNNK